MQHFDLAVIGSGPAGQRAAIQAAKLGKSVAVVEKRDSMGGVAINTGTIPSKALREAILKMLGRECAVPASGDFTPGGGDRGARLRQLAEACHKVIDAEVSLVEKHFRSNGVVSFHGTGRFVETNRIEITGKTDTKTITADKFLIGVGTHPARPASIPFDHANIITSDEIIDLPYLPNTMIVVGGGVIGTEYASMLQAIGVRVTLVEGRQRLLDFVDGEITEALQYHLRHAGMTLRLGEKVTGIRHIEPPPGARTFNESMVEAQLESDKVLRADCLLYAIGRQGATEDLGLEVTGLEADNRGRVNVNEHFQTEVPHIYAAGDVVGFPALASTSMEQGRAAALHMFGQHTELKIDNLPFGIYAVPEISMVGWTEERLTKENIPFETGVAQYREIARGQLLGDELGMLKLLIHQETRHILGVHVIGTGATELVHIGQTAMAHNATVDYFVNAVFNYPTLAECYKVAALNGVNKLQAV